MKKLLTVVGAGLLVFGMALANTPQAADAQAVVFTKADGASCFIGTPSGNAYLGLTTIVFAPNGNVSWNCRGELIGGPGVDRGTITRDQPGSFGTLCHIAETPSGIANANCKN